VYVYYHRCLIDVNDMRARRRLDGATSHKRRAAGGAELDPTVDARDTAALLPIDVSAGRPAGRPAASRESAVKEGGMG